MAGLAYIAMLGLGSLAGMLILSALMSLPLAYLEARYSAFHRGVQLVAGLASVGLGVYLLAVHAGLAS
jgi:high-affinity nickel-transport protein